MIARSLATLAIAVTLALAGAAAMAQGGKPAKAGAASGPPLGGLGGLGNSSKEPIKIDSDRLDVFDKDKKAVFSGNVVAVQGETTMRCSSLTVFYEQSAASQQGGKPAAPAAPKPAAAGADNGVRRLDCAGPVTVISKDQIATADSASYDKTANKVVLHGNAKLSQGPNVTTGDSVVYDLNTSQATVVNKPGERVRALLVPGSDQQQPGQPKAKSGKSAATN
ncbi:LptA/OstA family protein [Chelatococcus reniformis]|uniref:Organic solvent tolerance-like N-terminal domain-containing protein n=1 Tax=Chelatococcus reniformis TaxID=1494448 RepID=A0A916TWE7_9HYPH|nr:LptA/OstA family protein [Chelatococcus reniformis]GGC46587.1 hypothetical protein GCM10010994_02150 [Chelatococcus reniformis]